VYKCWENSLHTILWNRWAHYGNKEHSIFMCLKSGEAIFSNSFSLFLYFGVIFCFIICTGGHISPHKRYLKLIIKCYNRSFSSFTYFANMVLAFQLYVHNIRMGKLAWPITPFKFSKFTIQNNYLCCYMFIVKLCTICIMYLHSPGKYFINRPFFLIFQHWHCGQVTKLLN
jgi:magnesium-transporting ATPase (P-type)